MRFLSLVLMAACASEARLDDPEAIARGRAVYERPMEDGNTFSCSTCHDIEEGTIRRPGHPLGDAFARGSWKNGQLDRLIDAVNTCQEDWMNATPSEADDADWLDLEAFLASTAPETADPLVFEVVAPGDPSGGDPEEGEAVFTQTCVACHANDGSATQLAPNVLFLDLEPEYIARRIRTSGRTDSVYEGLTGGVMPFWAEDRLSDQEMRDVVAYVAEAEGMLVPPTPPSEPPVEAGDVPECASADHPSVGQVAVLQDFFHDVGGTVEIIDDCSVRITDFSFDGQGVDVRIYGGANGDYNGGFSMSENDLRRSGGYDGDTIYATLPEGRTWDDVDGVSVWCVPVGIDFGSGLFN